MATLKLVHLLFLFIWVGSLLSLTRLCAYLPKEEPFVQSRLIRIFRRMYLLVDLPAMVIAIASGIFLWVLKKVDMKQGWCHMKLTFAFLLIVADIYTGITICKLKTVEGKGLKFKVLHGLIAIFVIAILVSVYILKPRYQ